MFACVQCGNEAEENERSTCSACEGPLIPVRGGGDELIGRVIAGKYIILDHLGKGGMGSVYRARTRSLQSFVAIKLLALTSSRQRPEALRRFNAEARNSSRLRHPHNVRAFDFGHTEDGLVYIVMELIDGIPLAHQEMPLSPERAVDIMVQVCRAVGEAHAIGLIHRDLKPENIMLSSVDDRDFARVVDYGLSKFEDSKTNITRHGHFLGTPEYIAPELLEGNHSDRRSDIYALGLVLYKMVAGRAPFVSENPLTVAYRHLHESPPPPQTFASITPALNSLILDCLSKDPDERPQSVEELRDRLTSIDVLVEETVACSPQSDVGSTDYETEEEPPVPDLTKPEQAKQYRTARPLGPPSWGRHPLVLSFAVGVAAVLVLATAFGDLGDNLKPETTLLIAEYTEPTAAQQEPTEPLTARLVAEPDLHPSELIRGILASLTNAGDLMMVSLEPAVQRVFSSEIARSAEDRAASAASSSDRQADAPPRSERRRRRAVTVTPGEPTLAPPPSRVELEDVSPDSGNETSTQDLRDALRNHTRDLVRRGGLH